MVIRVIIGCIEMQGSGEVDAGFEGGMPLPVNSGKKDHIGEAHVCPHVIPYRSP
jgi:hypothetical protein